MRVAGFPTQVHVAPPTQCSPSELLEGIAVLPSAVSTSPHNPERFPPGARGSPTWSFSHTTPPTSAPPAVSPCTSPVPPPSPIPSQPAAARSPGLLARPASTPLQPHTASIAVSTVPETPQGVVRSPTPRSVAAPPSSTAHHHRIPAAAQPQAQPQASPAVSIVFATPNHSLGTVLYRTPAAAAAAHSAAAAASTTRLQDTPGSFVPDTPMELEAAATTAADAAGPRGRARLAHRLPPPPTFSEANVAQLHHPAVVVSELPSSPAETHAMDESPLSPNATQAFPTTQFESANRSRFAPTWPDVAQQAARNRADGQWQASQEGTTAAARTPVLDAAMRLVSEQTAGSSPRVVAGGTTASAGRRDTHSGPVRNRLARHRQNPQVRSL